MGIVTNGAQSIIHGEALLPKSNKAWIWYEAPRSTTFEILVGPSGTTACTLAAKLDHPQQRLNNFE
jgi:hypothetical protein